MANSVLLERVARPESSKGVPKLHALRNASERAAQPSLAEVTHAINPLATLLCTSVSRKSRLA